MEAQLAIQANALEAFEIERDQERVAQQSLLQQHVERLEATIAEKNKGLEEREQRLREVEAKLAKQEGECELLYESIREGGVKHQASLATQVQHYQATLRQKDDQIAKMEAQSVEVHVQMRRHESEVSLLQQRYEMEMQKHQLYVDLATARQEEAEKLTESLLDKEKALQRDLTTQAEALRRKSEELVAVEAAMKQKNSQLEVLTEAVAGEQQDKHRALDAEIDRLRQSLLKKEKLCLEQEQQYVELEATLRRQESEAALNAQLAEGDHARAREALIRTEKEATEQRQELVQLQTRFETSASTLADVTQRLEESESELAGKTERLFETDALIEMHQASLQGKHAELHNTKATLVAGQQRLNKLHALVEIRLHAWEGREELRQGSLDTQIAESRRKHMELKSALKKSLAREEELTAELRDAEMVEGMLREANLDLDRIRIEHHEVVKGLELRHSQELLQVKHEARTKSEAQKEIVAKATVELQSCLDARDLENEQHLRDIAGWQKKLETSRGALDVELRRNIGRPVRWAPPPAEGTLVGFAGHLLAFYMMYDYQEATRCKETIGTFLGLSREEDRSDYLVKFNTVLRLKYQADLLSITDEEARAGDFMWAHYPWDNLLEVHTLLVDADGRLDENWQRPTTLSTAAFTPHRGTASSISCVCHEYA